MNTLPAVAEKRSIIAKMAARFSMDSAAFEATMIETIMPGGKATKAQVAATLIVADQYQLNPFTKEIYAFPTKGGGVMPVISIDGWLKLVNGHPELDGIDTEELHDENGKLTAVRCTIHRKDRSRPTVIAEYLDECRRNTDPWKQMPRRMLRHKAIIQCARVAMGFSGLIDDDEAQRLAPREVDVISHRPATLEEAALALSERNTPALPAGDPSDNLYGLPVWISTDWTEWMNEACVADPTTAKGSPLLDMTWAKVEAIATLEDPMYGLLRDSLSGALRAWRTSNTRPTVWEQKAVITLDKLLMRLNDEALDQREDEPNAGGGLFDEGSAGDTEH